MKLAGLVLAAGGIALAGCVTTQTVAFSHPTATQEQMMADRYECLQESMGFVAAGPNAAALPSQALMANCMALRGYTRDPNGNLVVPPELVAQTY